MTTFNPKRADFEPYGFSCVRWQASIMPRTDRHNEIEINLLGEGELTYLFGGNKIIVPKHRLVIFWAGIPHQVIDIKELSEYYVMTIPLSWFLQLEFPKSFVQNLLHRKFFVDLNSSEFFVDEIRFNNWLKDFDSEDEELRRICMLEVEARLRRFIHKSESTKTDVNSLILGEGDLNNVEMMAAYIAQHFKEPLTTEEIANSVNLHPNYAMRLFRKTFGKTMIEYITEFRLSHAQQMLITSNELIIDIAHNSGFGSLSRFNAAFKKAFQCTPSEYKHRYNGN